RPREVRSRGGLGRRGAAVNCSQEFPLRPGASRPASLLAMLLVGLAVSLAGACATDPCGPDATRTGHLCLPIKSNGPQGPGAAPDGGSPDPTVAGADSDASSPAAPRCPSPCPPSKPLCDPDTGRCSACLSERDCTSPRTVCDRAAGR